MQTTLKRNLIELEGNTNINAPIKVSAVDQPRDLFTVRTESFELYTEGALTGRHRFMICRGTWEAYEVHTPDGQKNVIVQRLY